jgi:hypothetical protein
VNRLQGYDDKTEDWKLYEAGKNYNNRLEPNYYDTVNTNLDFVEGNQWRNLKTEKLPKPVFNILKRVVQFFVASLTASNVKIHLEPLMYVEDDLDPDVESELNASEIANAQIDKLLEKFKMEYRIKDLLNDAAITGDMGAHYYFDINKKPFGGKHSDIKGEIVMELVDGVNVFFGNANNSIVEDQPYIIISGRDMVKNLQEEAKQYNQSQENNSIETDKNYNYEAGDSAKIEVDSDEYGKALYIIVYRKVKKTRTVIDPNTQEETEQEYITINASKSVENAYIYKNIDTGLSCYPIAFNNWEKQKNQYHGRALVTGILPNQIFINRMFAMVMHHLMSSSFPKTVYNADLISNWTNEIGAAIPVRGVDPGTNLNNVAGTLSPGNMSNQIVQTIELAMQYTKETLGISDAALGNIDPKNTSAIIAVQKSSAIPLENPRANLYEFIEDTGKILLDMIGTYYGTRPIVIEKNGQKQLVEFDFDQLKDTFLNVSADVGESSYWSEIASIQTLDNLLTNGHIDIVEYLKRMPDEYIPQKESLISEIKERMQMMQPEQNPMELISQLPPEQQEYFASASPEEQEMMLQELMNAAQAPQM